MVFSYVDDIRNLARHMSQSSSMPMMGSKLNLQISSKEATGVGATYHYSGRVLGMVIDFSETVTRYLPGQEKVWHTIGQPQLLILDSYEMSVSLVPISPQTAHLMIAIAYDLPRSGVRRLIGNTLAGPYARCMVDGAKRDLEKSA